MNSALFQTTVAYFCIVTRSLIAILLFVSLSYQSFVKLGVVIWYQCNKEYISTTLCENRDKPAMKCCGKCVLRQQLRKADDTTPQQNTGKNIPSKWSLGELAVFIVPDTVTLSNVFPATAFKTYPNFNPIFPTQPIFTFFHPPDSALSITLA